MNGLTRHEMEDIQRQVDQLSNKADLSFNWSSNPSKQSMAAVILYRLGITLNEKHFSRGGTVTGEALKEIINLLCHDTGQDTDGLSKQNLAIQLGLVLGINAVHKNFSNGSTITSQFWKEVLVRVTNNVSKQQLSSLSKSSSYRKISADKDLGVEGEKFVINFEKKRLNNSGFSHLANEVLDVSQENCGYDILSFDDDSKERLIEVKTTKNNLDFPFFLTRNEVNTSKLNLTTYWLYRVYGFSNGHGNIQCLKGDMELLTDLTPRSFSAIKHPNSNWISP